MNVAAIPQLENAENRLCMFGEVREITIEDRIPKVEYLHIDVDGKTHFSKEAVRILHLETKTFADEGSYYNSSDRRLLESFCRNAIIHDVEDLTTALRIEGCKYIYRTPIYDDILIDAKEIMGDLVVTAKLKICIFGKKDRDIFLEAFSL